MKRNLLFLLLFFAAFSLMFAALDSRAIVLRTLEGTARTFEPTHTATVLFVGDMMFDRHVRTALSRGTDVLAPVAPLLDSADLNVGNLEGPVTDQPSQSQRTKVGDLTNMRFTFDPSVTTLLKNYGFDLVSIGNNHIRDYGPEGVHSTTNYLSSVGITYVGDPLTPEEAVVKDVNGIKIAFVAYSDFVAGDAARAKQAITNAEGEADVTVVLAHWGNEYETEPPPRVRELARSFVTAGADLVIGSHPHVIGTTEDIGLARVYYSLGNFVFDQYWEPSVRCGLVVTATFTKKGGETNTSFEETRVGMQESGETVPECS